MATAEVVGEVGWTPWVRSAGAFDWHEAAGVTTMADRELTSRATHSR
jgi:hypothetical protein